MDEEVQQTVEDQPQQLQEEAVAEEATADAQDEQDVEEVASQEAPEAVESDPQPEAEAEDEEPEWVPQPLQRPQVDTSNLQRPQISQFVDASGNVDLMRYEQAVAAYEQQKDAAYQNALSQAVSTATQSADLRLRYEKEWSKAETKYPELAKNRQMRDMVQAIHANSAVTGKYLSPVKAADQLFSLRGEAKAEGIKAARETRTVQAAAGLANPNPPAPASGNKASQLKEQMRSGKTVAERKAASQGYLKAMIDAGLI